MKTTKKRVLWVSLIGFSSVLILGMIGSSKVCGDGNLTCRDNMGSIITLFYPLPFLLFFSLITYKTRDEIFHTWWKFARWWVPITIVVTLLLSGASGGGGGMGGGGLASGMFQFAVLWLLYIIFVLVSLFKIIWEYLGMKDRKKRR